MDDSYLYMPYKITVNYALYEWQLYITGPQDGSVTTSWLEHLLYSYKS